MLKRYSDFIFESLLTESVVVYSDKFRDILTRVKSPVASKLLDIETQDLDVANNYLDVTDTGDQIFFTPDTRIQRMYKDLVGKEVKVIGHNDVGKIDDANDEIYDALGFESDRVRPAFGLSFVPFVPFGEVGIIQGVFVAQGDIRRYIWVWDGNISSNIFLKVYFPKYGPGADIKQLEKDFEVEESGFTEWPEMWIKYLIDCGGTTVITDLSIQFLDPSVDISKLKNPFGVNRQTIRVGRGVTGLLNSAGSKFSQSEIETFINLYKAQFDLSKNEFRDFELVQGKQIRWWYLEDNYIDGCGGTLKGSCMRYPQCQTFFDIYVNNPGVCSLLIYKNADGNKIRGRALVWKLHSGETYMDRIYTHSDSDVHLFRKYAEKKGWYCKAYNSNEISSDVIAPDGSTKNMAIDVQLESNQVPEQFPYMDTLAYYDPNDKILQLGRSNGFWELRSTSGKYSVVGYACRVCNDSQEVECSECDGDGQSMCNSCDGAGGSTCDWCGGDGEVECGECEGGGRQRCPDCRGGRNSEGCERCGGDGEVECELCDGDGSYRCDECDGDGTRLCSDCAGRGNETCYDCGGAGQLPCPECN